MNPDAHLARFVEIEPYVARSTVLDLGCASGWRRSDWFHGLIAGVASECVGVDLDGEALTTMSERGYQLVHGDAQTVDLGRTFDVVHAGELVEHLDDPHALLASARRHMRADSRLVLTTPNAFCVTNFLYRLGGQPKVNRDHVCWYCEDTLRQLLERNDFEILELRYLRHATPGRARAVVSGGVRRVLPDRLAWNTLLAVGQAR